MVQDWYTIEKLYMAWVNKQINLLRHLQRKQGGEG